MTAGATPVSSVRHHQLGFDGARDWWARRGWGAHFTVPHAALLIAEERSFAAVTVRRVWTTPTTLTPLPVNRPVPQSLGSRSLIWLQVEGTPTCVDGGGFRSTIPPFTHAVLVPEEIRSVTVETPAAHLEVEMTGLTRAAAPGTPPRRASVSWKALANLINVLLNGDDTVPIPVGSALGSAVEALALALALERRPVTTHPRHPHGTSLHARALTLIDMTAHDPATSVESIAAHLGVTREHLARVFRERASSPGATARSALQARRLALAKQVLAAEPLTDLAAVAPQCGFPSARALRSALRAREDTRVVVSDAGEVRPGTLAPRP